MQAGGPHDVERTLAMQLGNLRSHSFVLEHLAKICEICVWRLVARLVLMTVHDVMKLDILRPIVGVGELNPQMRLCM